MAKWGQSKYSKFYKEWVSVYKKGVPMTEMSKIYKVPYCSIIRSLKIAGITFKDRPRETNQERYNRFVVKKDGCWGWNGTITGSGYGCLSINSKAMLAHRYSYSYHVGEIGGNNVLHKCDNRLCTNPDHLFLGSSSDNFIDCIIKGRQPRVKLSVADVLDIRKRISDGDSPNKLSNDFSISLSQVNRIKNRRQWAYIK